MEAMGRTNMKFRAEKETRNGGERRPRRRSPHLSHAPTHTHALNRQKRQHGGFELALCFQPSACKTTQKPQQTCASALSVYFVTSQRADSKSRVTQSGFPSSLSGLFSILETPTAVLLFKKNTDEVIFFFFFFNIIGDLKYFHMPHKRIEGGMCAILV